MAKAAFPPGPPLGIRETLQYIRDPVDVMERMQKRYGDIYSFPTRGPMGRIVFIADPDTIHDVFVSNPDDYYAGEGNSMMLGPILGDRSILNIDGEDHRRERKILLPSFHGERIRAHADLIADVAASKVDNAPRGEPLPLEEWMRSLTLEILLRAAFGIRDEERLARYRTRVWPLATPSNWLVWLPASRLNLGKRSPWHRFLQARTELRTLLDEEIALRRADPDAGERDDVLTSLLAAEHEDGSPITDEEVRDQMMTVIGAGYQTTAATLCWMFEELLEHPEVEDRVRNEIDSGGDEYLDAVVTETLRLHPAVFAVPRRTKKDVELNGYKLPTGTFLVLAIALVQRRADVYSDPLAFKPERFMDGRPDKLMWIPFGGGTRRCIGAGFAKLKIRIAARTILERVRLEKTTSGRPEHATMRYVTVVPSRRSGLVLHDRSSEGVVPAAVDGAAPEPVASS